jgi:cyanophycin synthetase
MPRAPGKHSMPRAPREMARALVIPGGRVFLEAAVRLDLLRTLGPREAWRRRRQEAALARLPQDGVRPGYRDIWLAAAERVGAEATELQDGFIEFRRGDRTTLVWHSWVPLDDAVTLQFSEHKELVNRRLASAGLPVPEQLEFRLSDTSPALAFLSRADGPCVVKPLTSAGGSGATSGIRTAAQLRRALLRAGRLGRRMLIERQVPGDLYRLLFLDGALLDAVRRLPPSVTGDGRSTIAELIAAENERRLAAAGGRRAGLLRIDLDAIFTLEHAGRTARSVPAAGEHVAVKTVVNQNSAADNTGVREAIGPELIDEATRAVRTVGVRLAGVDLITPDPGRPLAETGGALLEVNGTPGLHYHYEISNRERAVPVAVPILERLLA